MSNDKDIQVGSATVRRRKLTDYQPNPRNHNKGTERGAGMLEESFHQYGPGRSLVADEDDVLIAGNQSQEAALNAGIEEVIEIETAGDVLVVHKRRDLDLDADDDTGQRAVGLAYMDNRSQQVSFELAAEQLFQDMAAGVDMSTMFRQDELDALYEQMMTEANVEAALDGEGEGTQRIPGSRAQVKVVLYALQVALLERALRETGILNRGDALIAVCESYLGSRAEGGKIDGRGT